MRKLLPLLLALALAPLASAQVTFTVTATANATADGYNVGQSYSFIYSSTPAVTGNLTSSFSGTLNFWQEDLLADTPVWTSVSGTGLHGSFTPRPANPYSYIQIDNTTGLTLYFGSDGDATSLKTVDDLTDLGSVEVIVKGGNLPTFHYPGSEVSLTSYFLTPGYTGTFTGFSSGVVNAVPSDFTVNSLTISAIPEPSTYAALFGLAALGLVAWRRRRSA